MNKQLTVILTDESIAVIDIERIELLTASEPGKCAIYLVGRDGLPVNSSIQSVLKDINNVMRND